MEGFDWRFNPSINKEKIEVIASLEFIKNRGINLFLGQPGTGKSHLAKAIGLKTIYEGHDVYWSSLKQLSEGNGLGQNRKMSFLNCLKKF